MKPESKDARQCRGTFSLLVMLVVMIFAILLISMAIAGAVSLFLFTRKIIEFPIENIHIISILYMASVSLITGTILARVGGGRFLRQIHQVVEATKQVAAGNFSVRLRRGRSKEIGIFADSFNEMVKELANIETLRSDFVSNISHEFKTPIASIRGFARRLKKDNLTAEQRNEYLDIILSESERLSRLSSNVLLLSRLESTEKIAERTEYSLDEQIRRTILLLEPQLNKKALEIDITLETVQITSNEEMLSHLWINLLENAIKFSPNGTTIIITLTKSGDEAVVTVGDAGIGMDEEIKKRIFDKFFQGDRSRATEGTGLGLSLVKRILDLEKGKIKVDSEPGRGTCFTVTLPIN